ASESGISIVAEELDYSSGEAIDAVQSMKGLFSLLTLFTLLLVRRDFRFMSYISALIAMAMLPGAFIMSKTFIEQRIVQYDIPRLRYEPPDISTWFTLTIVPFAIALATFLFMASLKVGGRSVFQQARLFERFITREIGRGWLSLNRIFVLCLGLY